jgi:hypothetical protein
MKKRQENNEKARKDMAKVKGQKNPHFESVEVEEEKKELPKSKMFRKAGNLGREVVSPSVTDDQRQKAYDRSKKIIKTLNKENQKEEVDSLTAAYNAVYEVEETETVAEDDKSYDRNRKRAAQRAADRNAARAAGKTGAVPGVGYVTARKEKETYVDSAGTTRHKSGAKNEEYEVEGFIPIDKEKQQKIDKKIEKTARAETIESGRRPRDRDDKKVDNLYKRQIAMKFQKKMKKEELEATGKFTAEEIEAIINVDVEEAAAVGAALGNIAGRTIGAKIGGAAGADIGKYVGAAGGAAALAKKGQKGKKAAGAALGSMIPGGGIGLGSAAGAALANSHEMEGNPIHEVFKDDIQQFAVNEIAGALSSLASQGAKAVKGLGAMGGATGTKIADTVVQGGKNAVAFAKKNPLGAGAIGAGAVGAGALVANSGKKK